MLALFGWPEATQGPARKQVGQARPPRSAPLAARPARAGTRPANQAAREPPPADQTIPGDPYHNYWGPRRPGTHTILGGMGGGADALGPPSIYARPLGQRWGPRGELSLIFKMVYSSFNASQYTTEGAKHDINPSGPHGCPHPTRLQYEPSKGKPKRGN